MKRIREENLKLRDGYFPYIRQKFFKGNIRISPDIFYNESRKDIKMKIFMIIVTKILELER